MPVAGRKPPRPPKPKAPPPLVKLQALPRSASAGARLRHAVLGEYELATAEVAILDLAAAQLDDIAALEKVLKRDGLIVTGSTGQPRLSAVVAELRQSRIALAKLLGELALPIDDEAAGMTPASRRAQHAARSRWGRRDRFEADREDLA
jgi:hypothetical protein